jgi:nucleotide-binding universal stress UspA family protein
MSSPDGLHIMVGYDASLAANAAIDAGAQLVPQARASVVTLWTPPFFSDDLRKRLWDGTRDIEAFQAAVEREGRREAEQIAAAGATLARAAGWTAESRIERSLGSEGLQFAQVADQADADLLLVGSRGLGGARAVLGSFSDMVVHYSPRPVLVVPYPLLSDEHAVLAAGPVALGWDGSAGARAAYVAARALLPDRKYVLVSVDGAAGSEPSPGADDGPVTMVEMTSGIGGRGRAIAEVLSADARNRGAALIVVGSRGRSAVREILLGSVAMGTLHHAYRPVLVVPQPTADLPGPAR